MAKKNQQDVDSLSLENLISPDAGKLEAEIRSYADGINNLRWTGPKLTVSDERAFASVVLTESQAQGLRDWLDRNLKKRAFTNTICTRCNP